MSFSRHVRNAALRQYQSLPSIKVDFHPQMTYQNRFRTNKTALYIETDGEKNFHILPLLLHMLEVIPPDWRVVFMGTDKTANMVSPTGAHASKTRHHVEEGRLVVRSIEDKWTRAWGPRWDDLDNEEMRSRLLTNRTFYREELSGTEYLFLWSSGSILCANSGKDLNDWIEWDFIGAPWSSFSKDFNGEMSLRRVSQVLRILEIQSRAPNEASEGQWIQSRINLMPNKNVPDPVTAADFAVEALWTDEPMGYLVHHNDFQPNIWNNHDRRKSIYNWCPEIKIVLDMKLSRERCPGETPIPPAAPTTSPSAVPVATADPEISQNVYTEIEDDTHELTDTDIAVPKVINAQDETDPDEAEDLMKGQQPEAGKYAPAIDENDSEGLLEEHLSTLKRCQDSVF